MGFYNYRKAWLVKFEGMGLNRTSHLGELLTLIEDRGRNFVGVADVTDFGADSSNANGTFEMSNVTANQFTLTATGGNKGVVIAATFREQGILGTPTIKLP